jgi:hypothetical protein
VADLDLDAIAALPVHPLADIPLVIMSEAERDGLVAAVRWAQDAPHHAECGVWAANYQFGTPIKDCTCGRDEVIPRG